MPRGQKKKAVVVRAPDGHIIGHMYINNHRQNTAKVKTFTKYDSKTRTRVSVKIKDEKHSS